MRITFAIAVATCALSLQACNGSTSPLVLATTTSVANSGLLDEFLPSYSIQVRTVQVGSGRALAMLAARQADAAISHAPEQEAAALAQHPGWFYRKILFNQFLIVGPADDPARIAGMTDAPAAMKRILDSGQRFLSRGDESGTHERERQFWKTAGVPQDQLAKVIVAGASMAQTLRGASETASYTLTDGGTFAKLSSSLKLRELVTADPRLLNTYAVLADPQHARGHEFARWVSTGKGRDVLAEVLNAGRVRGFTLWPSARPGASPDASPF